MGRLSRVMGLQNDNQGDVNRGAGDMIPPSLGHVKGGGLSLMQMSPDLRPTCRYGTVIVITQAPHHMVDPSIRRVADLIRAAGSVVVLTGAGVSTPSGIPDFRSPFSGLWNTFDPMEVASIWGFHDNPERFYRWFMPVARAIRTARPNAAHYALATLEQAGTLDLLITQNIDGLHQQAGSIAVAELHGHIRSARCLGCDFEAPSDMLWARVEQGEVLRCETCGSLLKPNAILFGEPLPYESLRRAQEAALRCDLMLAIGTSLEVEPASDLPHLARRRGSRVVIINRQPTVADSLAEVTIRGDIADVVPQLVETLRP